MKKVILTIIAALALTICASAQDQQKFDVKTSDTKVAEVLADASISADDLGPKINWTALDELVEADEELSLSNKTSYRMLVDLGDDGAREKALRKAPYYKYVRENLYPKAFKK